MLRTAATVFSQKGFLESTVDDIIKEAGVSRGTFYLYFTNKESIFDHVTQMVVAELMELSGAAQPALPAREMILNANRGYLQAFQRHRLLLRNLYQVAAFNRDMAEKLHAIRSAFIGRAGRAIERGIASGEIRPINAVVASWALGMMVESFAYNWLSMELLPAGEPFDFETVVTTLTDLWYRSLYIDVK